MSTQHPRDCLEAVSKTNSCSPISQLPSEILSIILIHCTTNEPPIHRYLISPKHRLGWIIVTHVCRTWRKVALATPRMWCRPDFYFPELARKMLERSKSAPLELNISDHSPIEDPVVALGALADHLFHISSLNVGLHNTQFAEEFLATMAGPAPLLTTVMIYSYLRGTTQTLILPDTFLSNGAPRLKHLYLSGVRVVSDSPAYRNLTTLSVSGGGISLTLRQWINFLCNMPYLEELWLITCLPPVDSEVPDSSNPIHLPSLRNVHVTCSTPRIANFAQYIAFPSTARIHFKAIPLEGPRDQSRLLASLLVNLSGVGQGHIESLTVVAEHGELCDSLSFMVWTSGFEQPSSRPLLGRDRSTVPHLCIEITFDESTNLPLIDEAVKEICMPLDLRFLRTLEVVSVQHQVRSTRNGLTGETIQWCFGFLPRLENLTLFENALDAFTKVVVSAAKQEVSDITNRTPSLLSPNSESGAFSRLKMLRVRRTDFTRRNLGHRWRSLVAMLDQFERCGIMTRLQIVFSDCVFFSQQTSYLQERRMGILVEEGCRTLVEVR